MLQYLLMALNGITVLVMLAFFFAALRLKRKVTDIATVTPDLDPSALPTVSIIIPVHNEERHVKAALSSVLNLDYNALEVIVVNDRSTDGTNDILEKLRQDYPQLTVINITKLPADHLGKTNAMAVAAKQAKGDYLIFTDADVNYQRQSLQHIMPYVVEHKLDHLSLFPHIVSHTWLLQVYMMFLKFSLFVSLKIWRRKPVVGIGAFNLVKRYVYEAIGADTYLALNPIDDVSLGKLVHKRGYKSDIGFAQTLLALTWYDSIAEANIGFEKNIYAFFQYRWWLACLMLTNLLVFLLLPWVSLTIGIDWIKMLGLINYITSVIFFAYSNILFRQKVYISLFYPLGGVVAIYTTARAVMLSMLRGGMTWGGGFYSNKLLRAFLKKNKI